MFRLPFIIIHSAYCSVVIHIITLSFDDFTTMYISGTSKCGTFQSHLQLVDEFEKLWDLSLILYKV